jgi:hypothetical protein
VTPEFPVPDHVQSVRFVLSADSSPGLLPRLLQPFARRDLTPHTVAARCIGNLMHVEIALAAMPCEALTYVEGNLRQIVGVRSLIRDTPDTIPVAA